MVSTASYLECSLLVLMGITQWPFSGVMRRTGELRGFQGSRRKRAFLLYVEFSLSMALTRSPKIGKLVIFLLIIFSTKNVSLIVVQKCCMVVWMVMPGEGGATCEGSRAVLTG